MDEIDELCRDCPGNANTAISQRSQNRTHVASPQIEPLPYMANATQTSDFGATVVAQAGPLWLQAQALKLKLCSVGTPLLHPVS